MRVTHKCECGCGLVLPVVKREDGTIVLGLPWEEPSDLRDDEAAAWAESVALDPATAAVG